MGRLEREEVRRLRRLDRPVASRAPAGADAGAPPRTLALEVTEETALDEREAVGANLARLADLGVRLFVDDFGTGPTALRALDRTPLDGLKIDRSVVEDVESDGGERAIVEAVVGLARSRGIATIAEGVERPSQLAALEAIGCDLRRATTWLRRAPQARSPSCCGPALSPPGEQALRQAV